MNYKEVTFYFLLFQFLILFEVYHLKSFFMYIYSLFFHSVYLLIISSDLSEGFSFSEILKQLDESSSFLETFKTIGSFKNEKGEQ